MQFFIALTGIEILDVIVIPFIIALMNVSLIFIILNRFLQAFQISGYKTSEFFGWLKNTRARYMMRLSVVSILSILLLFLTNVSFGFLNKDYVASFSLVFYIMFVAIYAYTDHKQPSKVELKYTKRIVRLIVVTLLMTFGITFLMLYLSNLVHDWTAGKLSFIRFGVICITPLFTPFFMIGAHFILLPFEMLNNARYKRAAVKKLDALNGLITIGITGSYGKTSVKDILYNILKDSFNTVKTPNSFNTPLGLTRTILNEVNENTQIFIAEMGARNVGDIKELCDMVKPMYGILTGITAQHMKTFLTIDNIKKTKYELIEALPSSGYAFFNTANPHVGELYNKCTLANRIDVGGESYSLSQVSVSQNGSTFKVKVCGKSYNFQTRLLGEHNIQNILLSIAVADTLGIAMDEIVARVKTLECTPHRLEPIKTDNGITVIDDAYNANPEGAKSALKVLSSFSGQKIIVTPGFIEMGGVARQLNLEFAKCIATVCDVVILVGKIQTKDILEGLIQCGFNEQKIITAINLDNAKEKLTEFLVEGSVVLFENDLPDNYTEVI